ncbi:hypothetical protein LPC08_13975 [Roseomonas sp. OT10]|uniref:hypothetical protein n=1 Tax=Roseomonas cutis TaxID=2897332 RepID=UPI001E44B4BC|nr:hypothetical protein [Roseomonas sp. OT10]UFN47136.1 hypothetical protein LPC08_13975 [Roseomonas sp. OT10]
MIPLLHFGRPPRPAAAPRPPSDPGRLYRWCWRARLPERHGQPCRMLARGTLNSCLLEFEDGTRVITSRNAIRRIAPG